MVPYRFIWVSEIRRFSLSTPPSAVLITGTAVDDCDDAVCKYLLYESIKYNLVRNEYAHKLVRV